jgi:PIN domain nuclease of toxin-antitoxin system
MPVTSLHAEAVETLPWHHRDPFDRLLVAQALVEERVLVSADPRLRAYDVEVLW